MCANSGEQLRDVLFVVAFYKEGAGTIRGFMVMSHAGCKTIYAGQFILGDFAAELTILVIRRHMPSGTNSAVANIGLTASARVPPT